MKKALWIAVAFVLAGTAAGDAQTMSIAYDQVNVRAKPSKRAAVLYTAPKGYPVQVKKKKTNWLYVQDWRGKRGWVYRKLVSAIPTAIVQADTANIRRGPGRKKSAVTQASQGQIYKILAARGDWVKLGYYYENEPVGWIHHDLVWGN